MTIEEAGEIVLKGSPWLLCAICLGTGRVKVEPEERQEKEREVDRVECWSCKGGGHFLPADTEEAYRMLAAELPPKPLTPRERMAKLGSDFIKDQLNRPSPLKMILPPTRTK
jgi:hypothetical protein